jgi:hypothetical protein
MARDAKYGEFHIRGIPEDEPVFVFRAQDALVPLVLAFYRDLREAMGDDIDSIEHQRRRFLTWKPRKLPD